MDFEMKKKSVLNPFSPWRSSAASLQRTLVGRDHIVEDMMRKTARFSQGAPAKHCLLVGRRGLGKTHILTLLYHYFEGNCLLPGFEHIADNLLPVLLLEEERYSLNSLVIFLMKVFEKFAERYPTEMRWMIPAGLDSDDDIREYCLENLKAISAAGNKKIIILCDNLEEVLKQWQERDYKILRAFLSDQKAVMLIGTAVRIFAEIIEPDQPFYEFFEITPLVDLPGAELLNLFEQRFNEDGRQEEFEQRKEPLKNKLAAIAGLTGGNPRLLVFLYDIVTKRNIFEIESATEELLEGLSEYFRNRFNDLAPQERTVLDAFAGMDGPATPKEIAQKTRLKGQSTYAHIKNLKDAGFIQPVEYAVHKISRYDVTERLFRMWRQNATVQGKKKFRLFIKFLKIYYTPEELKEDFYSSFRQLQEAFKQENRGAVEEYLCYTSYLQEAAESSLKFEIFNKRADLLLKMGDVDRIIEKSPAEGQAWFTKGKLLRQAMNYEEALAAFDRALDVDKDNALYWAEKGRILGIMGRYEEALNCFRRDCELQPGVPEYYLLQVFVLKNLNRLDEALQTIEKALEINGNNADYWAEKARIMAGMGEREESIQCFQKSIDLKPGDIDHRIEYLGFLIYFIKDLEEAEAYLKEIEGKYAGHLEDNENYLHFKADFLIFTCRYVEAAPYCEKRLDKDPDNLDARIGYWINKACMGDFGERMDGLAEKLAGENLVPGDMGETVKFIYRIMGKSLEKGNYECALGLYAALVRLKEWHKVKQTQESIALYLHDLVELHRRADFIEAIKMAQQYTEEQDLKELIKPFLYAGQYLLENNRVIFEEIFPEVREIVFDILEKLKDQD
ncbi:MAG: tetratricopeptide repeat protein [Candidatus Aminicenantes bacterium]|nr:tetratricopeptide repeat protein [Candidatus Aminicenantes bacterium]